MSEIERIAALFEQTFEGKPYYGPSVMASLAHVTAEIAIQRPLETSHSIWELVTHMTSELTFARQVIEGTAGPWIAGVTTWNEIPETTETAWQATVEALKQAHRELVSVVRTQNELILDRNPVQVPGPFYVMLHGTLQHSIYHAGQISLLKPNPRG